MTLALISTSECFPNSVGRCFTKNPSLQYITTRLNHMFICFVAVTTKKLVAPPRSSLCERLQEVSALYSGYCNALYSLEQMLVSSRTSNISRSSEPDRSVLLSPLTLCLLLKDRCDLMPSVMEGDVLYKIRRYCFGLVGIKFLVITVIIISNVAKSHTSQHE